MGADSNVVMARRKEGEGKGQVGERKENGEICNNIDNKNKEKKKF